MLSPELGSGHAAARVHHASWRRGSDVAARDARAAAAMPVIGFLNSASPEVRAAVAAFRQGLKEPAMSRARTWRSNTAGRKVRMIDCLRLAADLVRRQVAVIAATSVPRGTGGQGSDHNDPDRLRYAADPVEAGLVASLNRPAGTSPV